MRTLKRLVFTVVILGLIVGAGALYWATSTPEIPAMTAGDLPEFSDDDIERGELLAKVGDCSACHTAKGGEDYAGGLALPTPFGTIYSTNITPDEETGIGTWSFDAFARAMREGVDREGRHLYPAFPYDDFTLTRDEDLRAIYAYLMSLDPVVNTAPVNELPFPFSFRPVLAGWKLLFLRQGAFEPDPELDDEQNHGAYLAASLGHCGACHSPRNAFGAVIEGKEYEGGEAEGWTAPPLGRHSISSVAWTLDDYADYLFDGWSQAHGIAAGPMTAVADHLYDADEDDVFAIAAWFAAVTPGQNDDDRNAALAAAGALDWPATEGVIFNEEIPEALSAGRDLFGSKCSKCHKERISDKQPISLALSYALNGPTANNLFHVVLGGISPPYGSLERKMEAISLSDEELVELARYLRWHFTDAPEWQDLAETATTVRANSH